MENKVGIFTLEIRLFGENSKGKRPSLCVNPSCVNWVCWLFPPLETLMVAEIIWLRESNSIAARLHERGITIEEEERGKKENNIHN